MERIPPKTSHFTPDDYEFHPSLHATTMSPSIFEASPIDMDLFFSIHEEDLLKQIHDSFPYELERIKHAYSIRTNSIVLPLVLSPSQILYNEQHDEVNRTLVSVLCLRWIWSDQYKIFTGTQPAALLLSRPSFKWLRGIFIDHLRTPMDLYALLVYVVINDLGKDPNLASDYRSRTHDDISTFNHDIILSKAAEAGLVPCYNNLPGDQKDMIKLGMQLGAEFNVGQLAQAENAPACLASLELMRGHENAFHLHFMQQILDVSGAAGHEDWTCAKKAIEPICEAYHNVYEVALGVLSGEKSLREGYDTILVRRGRMLNRRGFEVLDVANPQDRALLRLLCMGGVSDLELAELYQSVWNNLEGETKSSLVDTLNVDGSTERPAVQPTYMPAMLAQGLGEMKSSPKADQKQRLHSMLRYLARVMRSPVASDGQITVIERSVLWVVKDIVQREGFQNNPGVLETVAIPKDAVAMVAKPGGML